MTLTLTSCQRSGRETWDDTKTCGRYVSRGVHALFGQHQDRCEYVSFDNYSDSSQEYIPLLADQECCEVTDLNDCVPSAKGSPGDPGSAIPGVEGFSMPSGALAKLFAHIHFDTDNYTVKGKDNFHYLHEIANYMIKNPNTYIFVEGHADERGASAYNLALGSRRANSVRTCLIQNGVNPDQLFTISYGKERPYTQGHDTVAWNQNRRAQFKLYAR